MKDTNSSYNVDSFRAIDKHVDGRRRRRRASLRRKHGSAQRASQHTAYASAKKGGWYHDNRSNDNAGSNDGSQYNKWNKRWNDRSYTNADSNDGSWYNSSWYWLDGDSVGSNDTSWCNESASQKRRQRRKRIRYHGWFNSAHDSWPNRWNNSWCDDKWYDNYSRWQCDDDNSWCEDNDRSKEHDRYHVYGWSDDHNRSHHDDTSGWKFWSPRQAWKCNENRQDTWNDQSKGNDHHNRSKWNDYNHQSEWQDHHDQSEWNHHSHRSEWHDQGEWNDHDHRSKWNDYNVAKLWREQGERSRELEKRIRKLEYALQNTRHRITLDEIHDEISAIVLAERDFQGWAARRQATAPNGSRNEAPAKTIPASQAPTVVKQQNEPDARLTKGRSKGTFTKPSTRTGLTWRQVSPTRMSMRTPSPRDQTGAAALQAKAAEEAEAAEAKAAAEAAARATVGEPRCERFEAENEIRAAIRAAEPARIKAAEAKAAAVAKAVAKPAGKSKKATAPAQKTDTCNQSLTTIGGNDVREPVERTAGNARKAVAKYASKSSLEVATRPGDAGENHPESLFAIINKGTRQQRNCSGKYDLDAQQGPMGYPRWKH